MDNTSNWNEVEAHIERRENGCWIWDGFPVAGNIYRYIAEAYGTPLPTGKLYRMPECKIGRDCVNPTHLGTGADYVLALNGRRHEAPEPPKTGTVELTARDRIFLKALRISWE
jgi:hypothetical protein